MIINSRDPQALADLYGFGSFFKSVGRKTASVARGAAHGIQKAGSVGYKVGGWGASVATAPTRFAFGVADNVARNIVSTAVGIPVGLVKAVGQGVIDPFRPSRGKSSATDPNQATIDAVANLPPQITQPAPSQSSGGGGGGGGGPTGSDDAPVAKTGELALDPSQAPTSPQTFAEKLSALPTAAKLAIAAAAVGGAYVIYKKMKKRGGGAGRRSKR